MHRRHTFLYKLLRPLVIAFVKLRFDYRYEKAIDLPEQYMVLSNHATDYDPLLIACSFKEHMYFMGSEHIARWGFLSKLIRWLLDPVMRCKGASGVTAVKEMLRRIRCGHNICFFPEGVRTWDGVTAPITAATAKLAKTAGCGLVTYKITGGYFASPMWGGAKVRRGPVHGGVVHIYTAEQLKTMTAQQLRDAINRDLYEDAYARQSEDPKPYRSKLGAAKLENLLFICPECGAYDSYATVGEQVICSCGHKIGYNELGRLENCRFDTVKALLAWEKECLRRDVSDRKVYIAKHGSLCTVKNHETMTVTNGEVIMSEDALRCAGFCVPMEQITELAMHGQRHIVFTADGSYYDLTVSEGANALKFWLYYQELKERKA
jgi:1-acyl-sn-glycerol-3-phosphate acyltransferase